MRPRLNPAASDAAHDLALRLGISDQRVVTLAITKGLAALGVAIPNSPIEQVTGDGVDRVLVYLPRTTNGIIKALAKAENRSNRNMTRKIIYTGLRALGAPTTG
jgi:hypothetical protein